MTDRDMCGCEVTERYPNGDIRGWAPEDDCPMHGVDVHTWFSLSYASYLTVPRTVLQSMPHAWQVRLVACLREMDQACAAAGIETPRYMVQARDEAGRFIRDPFADYARGRTYLPGLDPERDAEAGRDQIVGVREGIDRSGGDAASTTDGSDRPAGRRV